MMLQALIVAAAPLHALAAAPLHAWAHAVVEATNNHGTVATALSEDGAISARSLLRAKMHRGMRKHRRSIHRKRRSEHRRARRTKKKSDLVGADAASEDQAYNEEMSAEEKEAYDEEMSGEEKEAYDDEMGAEEKEAYDEEMDADEALAEEEEIAAGEKDMKKPVEKPPPAPGDSKHIGGQTPDATSAGTDDATPADDAGEEEYEYEEYADEDTGTGTEPAGDPAAAGEEEVPLPTPSPSPTPASDEATSPHPPEPAKPVEEPAEAAPLSPTPAQASPSPAPSPAYKAGNVAGQFVSGLSTFFSAIGTPFSGCGVPPSKLVDESGKPLPWVALNTNGPFSGGKNCGRFVQIKLGKNCAGGSNSGNSVCNGGSYEVDKHTGHVMYGYVADSCADQNYWCQTDTNHLDLSQPYLDSEGMTAGWNGRKIEWAYMDGAPAEYKMGGPKFMWKDGSKWIEGGHGFWASLIVYNVPNGIASVQQKVGGNWKECEQLAALGQQHQMHQPDNYRGGGAREFEVKIMDINGTPYGEYRIPFNCASTCGSNTDVEATPM